MGGNGTESIELLQRILKREHNEMKNGGKAMRKQFKKIALGMTCAMAVSMAAPAQSAWAADEVYSVTLGTAEEREITEKTLALDESFDFNFYGVKDWTKNKENYKCQWSVEGDAVTVSKMGVVKAVKGGTAKVSLSITDTVTGVAHNVTPVTITVPEEKKEEASVAENREVEKFVTLNPELFKDVTIAVVNNGVVITKTDAGYGAMNYAGEVLVANEYATLWYYPNEVGQFILGNDTVAKVFDKSGTVLLELENASEYVTYTGFSVNDGVVVRLGSGDWSNFAEIYDLKSGEVIAEVDEGYGMAKTVSEGYYLAGNTAGIGKYLYDEDKYVYYSGELFFGDFRCSNVQMTTLQRDGYALVYGNMSNGHYDEETDDWVETRNAIQGLVKPSVTYNEYNPWEGYIQRTGSFEEGYFINMNEMAKAEGFGEGFSHGWVLYYENGRQYSNLENLAVFWLREGDVTKYYLLDFSKAKIELANDYELEELEGVGMVTNLSEVIVGKYDSLALSDTGYYMAGVDNDFFYVDRTGKKVADYKDCASFLDGYALVIEEDGMAYLVDEELNKVSEGQPADSVYRSNGALVSVKDGVETYFVPEYK